MKDTKEKILLTSLELFAKYGFDSVSTSMIASELGITKGALYRHFTNKQAIFDAIIDRMFELDAKRANENQVPEQLFEDHPESYSNISTSNLIQFTNEQFDFWVYDPFASLFRKMITIEQYKSDQMNELYQGVICNGPIQYTSDLLNTFLQEGKLKEEAARYDINTLALLLFAPLKVAIELADGNSDHTMIKKMLEQATKEFDERWFNQ